LVASLEFCTMFPLEKYLGGISNFDIYLTEITSPSRHWCNWLENFLRVWILVNIGCSFGWSFALEICSVWTTLKLRIQPFFYGFDTYNDHSITVHFLGDNIGFWGWS
jgi:hypothetical protein